MYHMYVVPKEVRKGHQPEIGVRNGYEIPCGWWEVNLDPMEEQVFSTAWPSLQTHDPFLKIAIIFVVQGGLLELSASASHAGLTGEQPIPGCANSLVCVPN